MKASEELKIFITDHGWTFKGKCNCSGMPTHKYELQTHDGEFQLRVRHAHFMISAPGKRFTKYPISELKNTVNEIFETHKITI